MPSSRTGGLCPGVPVVTEGSSMRSACLRLHFLAPQRAAGTFTGGLAFGPYRTAIHENMLDPGGRRRRRLEGGAVGNGCGIEHGNVGITAGCESAAAGQPE